MGVKEVYPWQRECIVSTGIADGDNLVYCAPTSGGKTLVSELLILRNALVLKKRAVFILPFVSLVIEKETHFKRVIKTYNRNCSIRHRVGVKSYHGDINGTKLRASDLIIICTIEKANLLINTLIQRRLTQSIGCVVIDELHSLGDSFNGYLLEILVSKLKYFRISRRDLSVATVSSEKGGNQFFDSSSRCQPSYNIQIVAMSATVGNIQALAEWFEAKLFVSTYRPIPLIEHVVSSDSVLDPNGKMIRQLNLTSSFKTSLPMDDFVSRSILFLCMEALSRGQQVLIFCSTRASCEQTCELLLKNLVPLSSGVMRHQTLKISVQQLQSARGNLLEALQDKELQERQPPALQSYVTHGFAYHHAGLEPEYRQVIEKCFKKGALSILAATSTLAAGVNLPAGRVLIRSMNIGRDLLSISTYKQMIGRAGRTGQCNNGFGESYLLVKNIELPKALILMNSNLPDVVSQINPQLDSGRGLMKAVLEMLSLGLCKTVRDIVDHYRCTLLFKEINKVSSSSNLDVQFSCCRSIVDATNFLSLACAVDFVSAPTSSTELSQLPIPTTCSTSKSRVRNLVAHHHCAQVLFSIDDIEFDSASVSSVTITRFGRAIVNSSMNPDEAIVVYRDLLQAQNGIDLQTSLHLLYLISPFEHMFTPNFPKLLKWYDYGKAHSKSSCGYFVGKAILGDEGYPYLNIWQQKAPSREDIVTCFDKMKWLSLRQRSNNTYTSSSTAKSITADPKYYEYLCRCKRLWAAMIVQELIADNNPITKIASDHECQLSDLENLKRNASNMASRVQRLCAECGWVSLEKLINEFKICLTVEKNAKEFKELMNVEGMTARVAKALFSKGIKTPEELSSCDAGNLSNYLRLLGGYSVQDVLDEDRTRIEKENSHVQDIVERATSHVEVTTKSAPTKNELLQIAIKALVEKLITSSKMWHKKICDEKESQLKSLLENISDSTARSEHSIPVSKTLEPNMNGTVYLEDLSSVGSEVESASDPDLHVDTSMDSAGIVVDHCQEEEDSLTFSKIQNYSLGMAAGSLRTHSHNGAQNQHGFCQASVKAVSSVAPIITESAMLPIAQNTDTSHAHSTTTIQPDFIENNFLTKSSNLERVSSVDNCSYMVDDFYEFAEATDYLTTAHKSKYVFHSNSLSSSDFYDADCSQNFNIYNHKMIDSGTKAVPDIISDVLSPDVAENGDSNQSTIDLLKDMQVDQRNPAANSHVSIESHNSKSLYDECVRDSTHATPKVPTSSHDQLQKRRKVSISVNRSMAKEQNSNETKLPNQLNNDINQGNNEKILGTHRLHESFECADDIYLFPEDPTPLQRRVSPYLTPFTASKFYHTPGHYLYLPQIGTASGCSATIQAEHFSSSQPSFPHVELPHLPVEQGFAERVCDGKSKGFGYRPLSKHGNCRQFLQKLLHCSCISFELLFRRIPNSSLSSRGKWLNLISEFCPEESSQNFCGVSSRRLLDNDYAPSFTGVRDPHVLRGVSFNFGDEFGYYLSLPAFLPVLFDDHDNDNHSYRNDYHSMMESVSAVKIASSSVDRLISLPIKSLRLICRFVGFFSILNKSPYLRSRTRGIEMLDSPTVETNPLLCVSRYWLKIARQTLMTEWCKGQCVEWRLLNEIMTNSKIAKCSTNIKLKLAALRERDVIVAGPVESPEIALALIQQSALSDDCLGATAQSLNCNQIDYPDDAHIARKSDPGFRSACYRAVAIMRSMAVLSPILRKQGMYSIFKNIEMPLLYNAVDLEYNGVCTNNDFFQCLRRDAEDRLNVIELYFKEFESPDFNVTSHDDVIKLSAKLLKNYRQILNHKLQEMRQHNLINEKFNFYANCLAEAESRLVYHPLLLLAKEHSFLTKSILPFCSAVSSSCRGGRVRGRIRTLGTDTGRLLIVHPPLQMAPKKEFYCFPTNRPSVHDEILSMARQRLVTVATICEDLNKSISCGQSSVLVHVRHLRQGGTNSEATLIRVSNRFICEPIECATASEICSFTEGMPSSLVQLWRDGGVAYTDYEASRIRQVLVEFTTRENISSVTTKPCAMAVAQYPYSSSPTKYNSNSNILLPSSVPPKFYSYPADQLYRVDAPICPNVKEVEVINKALLEGIWNCDHKRIGEYTITDMPGIPVPLSPIATGRSDKNRAEASNNFKILRNGFVAEKGFVLLSADYCQMEFRILAHFSEDEALCHAFQDRRQDVFRSVTAQWRNKPIDEITKEERETVKQLCYAYIYGSGIRSIAERLRNTVSATSKLMHEFVGRYPGIPAFIKSVKESCREKGYVETLLGRRRSIKNIHVDDLSERSKAERQAVNTVCQGSAADLIKLAMINISHKLSEISLAVSKSPSSSTNDDTSTYGATTKFHYRHPRSFPGGGLYERLDEVRPVLQIHDELVFEVREDLLYMVAEVVKECMEHAVALRVPLQVKLFAGSSWGSLEPLELPTEKRFLNCNLNLYQTLGYQFDKPPLARAIFHEINTL